MSATNNDFDIPIERRQFLRRSLQGLGGLALPRLLLVPRTGRRTSGEPPLLVTIFLRGGLDPLGAIVPHGDPRYATLRPTIAIPAPGVGEGPSVLPLDERFGLHPALAPIKPLFDAGQIAAVLSAGSPHPTRSHFDAQDFMEYAVVGRKDLRTGWLNRYLAATARRDDPGRLRAVALQPLLPRSLRGDYPVLAVAPGRQRKTAAVLERFAGLYRRDHATDEQPEDLDGGAMRAGAATIDAMRLYESLRSRPTPGRPRVTYPPGSLAAGLRGIAQLVWADAGLEIACVDLNGWDHHTGEGSTNGLLSSMLASLAAALAAFVADLGPHFARTAVLLVSEFGRTVRENGNAGTDHGHGGLMMVASGRLGAGPLVGRWRGLRDEALYEGRDLPVTTDFRDLYAEVLREHLGWSPPRDFFPAYKPRTGKSAGKILF